MKLSDPKSMPTWLDILHVAREFQVTDKPEYLRLLIKQRGTKSVYLDLRKNPFPTNQEKIHLAKLYLHDSKVIAKSQANKHGIPYDKNTAKLLINQACSGNNPAESCSTIPTTNKG